MCNHRFQFPEDSLGNLNLDGETLTGRCKCGATQKAYGVRWMIKRNENFLMQVPYEETQLGYEY